MTITNFINSIDTKLYSRIRASKGDAECRRYLKEHLQKQLTSTDVSQQRELLPAFLERKDFDIITLKTAGTSVLKDWEEYLKAVNCG
jgi:hypothetical protein